ncbi:ABC transporter permease [Kordiimonas sp. SCSIO 12610]|uniref:ABC transporter permease n=1 Tax=Kordiimonas sp. SCSIO 12610 TaxID=2829597 RepID=UPI00210EFE6F|nr:ABC transporter permease [Kordiimonas sp. SCSIO 12610]UTW55677.1 ABC transporter permease [Kordiimonas sp. SCSIO 12610]
MMRDGFNSVFKRLLSDQTAFMLILVAPILYSFLYPSGYAGELVSSIPVAIVDQDNSAVSRSIISKVGATQQARTVAILQSSEEALALIYKREIYAFVLIPNDYSEKLQRGEQGEITLYGNGAYLLRVSTALTAISEALTSSARDTVLKQSAVLGAPSERPIETDKRPLFNTTEGYGSFIVPGVVFMIMHQTFVMGLALMAATLRRERGGALTPKPSRLAGIALGFFLIACLELAYFIGFVFWLQDYPRASAEPVALIFVAMLFAGATVALALTLGSFFKTRERPMQIWVTTSVPIFFLSGLTWPKEVTPDWIIWLGKLFPTTPGIQAMISLNQLGAGLSDITSEIMNLMALILFFGAIAFYRYSRTQFSLALPRASINRNKR